MEKSKRSMAKTIWLSIRDTFSAMPVITTVTFIFQLISAGISVALVLFTARLIDTAGEEGSGELENLLLICAVIVGCYLVNLILEKISYRINQIDAVPKFEVFHHRLSAFTVSLSLRLRRFLRYRICSGVQRMPYIRIEWEMSSAEFLI